MMISSEEQRRQIAKDLTEFVHRVATDQNASPAEFAALPEIAKVLCTDYPAIALIWHSKFICQSGWGDISVVINISQF